MKGGYLSDGIRGRDLVEGPEIGGQLTRRLFLPGDLNEGRAGVRSRTAVVGKTIDAADRSIAFSSLERADDEHNPASNRLVSFARGVTRQNGRTSILGFGSFRTACVLLYSLPATPSSDHGCEFSTTETSRQRLLPA